MTGPATRDTPPRVCLLVEQAANRELLADRLGERYRVTTDPSVNPEAIDVCVVDPGGLQANRERIAALKAGAAPLFLPVLLVGSDGDEPVGVDETLDTPVRRDQLDRRVETLLRTRSLSVDVADRERQYRDLVDLLPEAVCIHVDGRVRYANRAAKAVFERGASGSLVGRRLADHLSAASDAVEAALTGQTGGLRGFETATLTTVGGKGFTAEVGAVPVRFENEDAMQVVVRDVTERNRRQERLRLYAEALDEADLGITVADMTEPDDPLIYVNEGFERLTGYDADATVGRNCRFLQGEDTDPDSVAAIRRALAAGEPYQGVLLNYRQDGTTFWNELTLTPVAADDGTVTHYLGFQRDVTNRYRREQQLSVLDRILRHNLRNRLTVVAGQAEAILHNSDDPAVHAAAILDAAEDLRALSDKARRFRELVDRDGTAGPATRDAADVVGRVVARCRATFPEATVTLTTPEDAPISTYGTVELALEELLENAVVHAEADDPEVAVTVETQGETVTISVADDGPGLPASEWPDDSTAESPLEHASSLGLWLVVWAVAQSGGSVERHVDDEGTTVTITLQRAD